MSREFHRVYEAVNSWRTLGCGCIANDQGFYIRYCGPHNMKLGTHWGSR